MLAKKKRNKALCISPFMQMIRVLFVSSGNSKDGISPIVKSQGDSLIQNGVDMHYYTIKGKGLKAISAI